MIDIKLSSQGQGFELNGAVISQGRMLPELIVDELSPIPQTQG